MLEKIGNRGVVAELGVNRGKFSEVIIEVTKPRVLHLVDIWEKDRYHIRKAFRAGGLRFSATGGPAYGWQVSGFRLPALPMSRY